MIYLIKLNKTLRLQIQLGKLLLNNSRLIYNSPFKIDTNANHLLDTEQKYRNEKRFGKYVNDFKRLFSLSQQQRQQKQEQRQDPSNKESSSEKDDDKNKNDGDDTSFGRIMFFFGMVLALVLYSQLKPYIDKDSQDGKYISWHEFVYQMLAKGEVKSITVNREAEVAAIELYPNAIINGQKFERPVFYLKISVPEFEDRLEKVENDLKIRSDQRIPVKYVSSENFFAYAAILLIGGLIYLAITSKVKVKISGPMDMMSQFRKANYVVVDPKMNANATQVKFKDVAGLKEAKIEITEFVDYIKQPERFNALGAKVPKGALLLGPPGCGKTLLARALASEAGVPFFSMAGTEFIEVIGGVGAARVRDLFATARKSAPSIIYIDEIDALGKQRSDQSNGEADQTLNQLLSEMDGLETKKNVIILASTNRPDVLDKALLRPGRFDRHITIDLPTMSERKEILDVYMKKLKLANNVNDEFVGYLAQLTVRMSGADLANVCNEAALHAARDGKKKLERVDFEMALERVLSGAEKRTTTITKSERKLIAYHECGLVLLSWILPSCDLLYKVSLIPRTKSLTLAHYLPQDKKLHSKEELFERMVLKFGGQVAESLIFNTHSTNSEKDLKPITKSAYAQVKSLGMSDVIGVMSFPTDDSDEGAGRKPYSKKLQRIMDEEAQILISKAHKRAEELVKQNIDKLHALAHELIKSETLNYEDIAKILGPPVNENRARAQANINFNKSNNDNGV